MVYVHVPFCRSFCVYCDFYSEIACRGRDAGLLNAYLDELCGEIDSRRAEIGPTLGTNTLYIGGGTPSVLPPPAFERIAGTLGCGPFEEFTVEVNPEDIVENGAGYVEALLSLGVNRFSMGVQSLDDGILKWMRRRHDASTARRAFAVLREAGAENVSLDLIFGLSQMSARLLSGTLDAVCRMRPEHVSAYQLGIEEGSELAAMVADGRYSEAAEDSCAMQYELICSRLREAGYVHYEISNWALPGFEAKVCRFRAGGAFLRRSPQKLEQQPAFRMDSFRRTSGCGRGEGGGHNARSAHCQGHTCRLVPGRRSAALPFRRGACSCPAGAGRIRAGPSAHPRIPLVRLRRHHRGTDIGLEYA